VKLLSTFDLRCSCGTGGTDPTRPIRHRWQEGPENFLA